jgi:hypothetical protein
MKAHLRGFAFCVQGAFPSAQVLALREPPQIIDEVDLTPDLDPELVERCRRLGIRLPQRYQAHPDQTGTPDESGTPDGTRQPSNDKPEGEEG